MERRPKTKDWDRHVKGAKNLNEMTPKEVFEFMDKMNKLGRPLRFSGKGDGTVALKQDVDN